jgi:hypothetical protein
MMNLSKYAVLDPRLDVGQSFHHWFTMLGSSAINTFVFPTTQFSQSNMSFNINIPNSTSCLIDRSSAILALPVTIVMAGDGGGSGNIYNPSMEGIRSRPLDKITSTLNFILNGTTLNYQVNELSAVQSIFEQNQSKSQMCPTMTDPTQAYSDAYQTIKYPFAKPMDNPYETTRRAYPITVNSNTTTACSLTTTLYTNLFDWGCFTKDCDAVGINVYPFVINYTFLSGFGLNRLWSRDLNSHTQHLTSMTITLGQPQITMTILNLPDGTKLPQQITYPYHKVDYYPLTTAAMAQNATASVTSQLVELSCPFSKMYVFAKPATNYLLSSLAASIGTTDTFAEILTHNYIYGNATNLLGSQTQIDIFEMTKSNGLPDKYGYEDWTGEIQNSAFYGMGSIVCIDPTRNFGGDHVSGLPEKIQLQATVSMKTLNPITMSYDFGLIIVYDGVLLEQPTMSIATVNTVSSKSELQMSPVSYNQMKALVGGSVGDFFKTIWSGIKSVAGPILSAVKPTGLISKGLSMLPYVGPQLGMVAKTLGYGDEGEDGGWIGGEDGGSFYDRYGGVMAAEDGDDGEGGVLSGGRRLRRSALKKKLMSQRRN